MDALVVWKLCEEKVNHQEAQENTEFHGTFYGPGFFFKYYHFPKRDNRTDKTDEYSRSDSPWSIVSGVMKYYRMSYVEVTQKRSYLTIQLLNAAIPGSKPVKRDEDNVEKVPEKEMHANEYFTQFM